MSTAYRTFRALPEPVRRVADRVLRWRAEAEYGRQPLSRWGDDRTRVLIAPLNTAGQAAEWGWALQRYAGEQLGDWHIDTRSVRAEPRSGPGGLAHRVDMRLSPAVQLRGMRPYRAFVLGSTHVLAESARAVLDDVHHRSITDDLPTLREHGIDVAVLLHGSEIRDLHAHAAREPFSPFAGEWDERWHRMQARVEATRAVLEELRGQDVPLFVSTPDLLADVPDATWLPVVAHASADADPVPVLARDVPVVVHAPSNPRLKGTAVVDEVLGTLQAEGRIVYRRLDGVPPQQMLTEIAGADAVVDQIALGNPGVLLAETLATGRVAIAHLPTAVRAAMTEADPLGEAPPVLEADPTRLRDVVEQMLDDRVGAVELAGRGPAWAARTHDGDRSGAVLSSWTNGTRPSSGRGEPAS